MTFEGQQPMLFHPVYPDIHGPLYHDAQSSQPQPQPLSPTSTLVAIDEAMWMNMPQTQEEISEELNRLYTLSGMVDHRLHEAMDIQNILMNSLQTPQQPSPNNNNQPPPPPPPQNLEPSLPPGFSSHDCAHCERTAHLAQRTNILVHELQNEMRFILNHVLERLNAISHPPQ